MIRYAVKHHRWALQFADMELQRDAQVWHDIVMDAVSFNGYALEFSGDALRDDGQIVKAAVICRGRSLQYASEVLRGNRGIVYYWPSAHPAGPPGLWVRGLLDACWGLLGSFWGASWGLFGGVLWDSWGSLRDFLGSCWRFRGPP